MSSRFVEILREEWTKELESTGAYTKAGMLLALERALNRAILRGVQEGL